MKRRPFGLSLDTDELKSLAQEARILLSLAWPVMITFLLETSLEILTIMFAGRLGSMELSAAVMGYMFCNLTGFAIGLGIATAMDKLAPQAYEESLHLIPKRNPSTTPLDIVFQKSLLISIVTSIPVMWIWWQSESLFKYLGQSEAIAVRTGAFVKYMLPSVLPAFIFENMKRWRQAQKDSNSGLFTMIAGIAINVILNSLLTWEGLQTKSQWSCGYLGAPIAASLTYCSLPVIMLLFVIVFDYRKAALQVKKNDNLVVPLWRSFSPHLLTSWWSKESWNGWTNYLGLGIPGAITLTSESGAFDLCCLLAGILGEHTLDQNAYLQSMVHLLFMLPFGISVAATNRVGRLIGSASLKQAKLCSIASILLCAVVTSTVSAIILCGIFPSMNALKPNEFMDILFVSEIPDFERTIQPAALWENIDHEKTLLMLGLAYFIFDGVQCVASGVLKGCGRHVLVAMGYVAAYFLVGFPIGFHFAFKDGFGLIGLWSGLVLGGLFLMIYQCHVLFQMYWISMTVPLCPHDDD